MQRQGVFNGLSAAGGFLMLIGGLAVIDVRVRDQLARVLTGRAPTGDFASLGERVQELLLIVMQSVRDQSIEHAPLVIFALAALVLVLFMVRT